MASTVILRVLPKDLASECRARSFAGTLRMTLFFILPPSSFILRFLDIVPPLTTFTQPKMPKRTDIHTILIIGSGPIVIGQGCEFDYSGVQACRALREEGYRIVLINSNPATIMTDPEFADATYIEPITPETVEKILRREQENGTPVDALLPTLGGQTGLNTGMACYDKGILTKYNVKMIGADREAIF